MHQKFIKAGEFLKLPAHDQSGLAIAEALQMAINRANGHHLTLADLAAQTGEPLSKIHRWFTTTSHPHLRMITHLLELLGSDERKRFWDEHCRELPHLQHPRLAHDQQGTGQLSAVLRKPKCLAWLVGSSHLCSFVLHAMGHSFPRSDGKHRAPIGISLHPPESLVPLPQLRYLAPLLSLRQQQEAVRQAWGSMRSSQSPLLLLDGIPPGWLREDLVTIAATRNVILTGAPESAMLARAQANGLAIYAVHVSAPAVVQAPITVRVNQVEP